MRALVKAFAVTVVALAVGVGVAAPAHADEESFLDEVTDYGVTGGTFDLLDLGYQVCDMTGDGMFIEDIAEYVYDHTGDSVSREQARFLVDNALIYLC